NALVVFQKLVRVIDDLLTVIFVEQLRVNFLFGGFEKIANIILFADENELARGGVILVFEEIMHPESEIVEIELTEILASDRERIEIVFLQIASELAATLLVFSPNKTGAQKKQRRDDGCDHVHADLALQRADHGGYFGL